MILYIVFLAPPPPPACEEGDIRLVRGNERAGSVEVCAGGKYGSVCDDEWDEYDAGVVCKKLGFSPKGE